MKLKQYSSIGLVLMATAGLLFAGCATKTTVGEGNAINGGSASRGSASHSHRGASTHGISTSQEPSSHSVYFAFNSSELDAAARSILDANAAWLEAHRGSSVTVEGNCDERGSREYNLALGQRRANRVRSYLVHQGASASSIDTVSFGEERPACQGTGEACWAQNRHADIVTR